MNMQEYLNKVNEITSWSSGNLNPSAKKTFFRGQARSDWQLESSLERETQSRRYLAISYFNKITGIAPIINSALNSSFKESRVLGGDFDDKFLTDMSSDFNKDILKYLSFLRQYNFPTPILDWTESHYIALFFACNGESDSDGKVFIVQSTLGEALIAKSPELEEAQIIFTDTKTKSNERQIIQKGVYSVAITMEFPNGTSDKKAMYFVDTQSAIRASDHRYTLHEIIIPKGSKENLLKELDKMNIDPYSLFKDIESLMKTLKNRTFMQANQPINN